MLRNKPTADRANQNTSFYNSVTSFYTRKAPCPGPACTFALLFHQPRKIMQIRILAILFFSQAFIACQQVHDMDQQLGANLVAQANAASQQDVKKTTPVTTDIVYQSVDGGQNWQDLSAGLPKDLPVRRVFANGSEVYLGSENGLYHSTKPPAALPWAKEVLFNGRITNIFSGQTGPYVSSFGDGFFQEILRTGIWKPLHNNLEDKTIHTVLEIPEGIVFVGCESGIYKSTDNGQNWKQVFADGRITSLVTAGGVLVGSGSRGVLRSTDGGEHWDWVLTEDGAVRKTGVINGQFFAISFGGGTWQEVETDPLGTASRLRISKDGGKTWERMIGPSNTVYDVDKGLFPARIIYDMQQDGDQLFCSCNTGIFRSTDRGKTWKLVLPAPAKILFDFTISGHAIYAVKVFDGC